MILLTDGLLDGLDGLLLLLYPEWKPGKYRAIFQAGQDTLLSESNPGRSPLTTPRGGVRVVNPDDCNHASKSTESWLLVKITHCHFI